MGDNVHVDFGQGSESYSRTFYIDGVRLSITNNAFEISVQANTEVWEQHTIQVLRKWIRWRKEQAELRESRVVPR